MTNFIPVFPLQTVVFPGETVNLHIFEPRYKQLISECFAAKKSFGIPVVIKNRVAETGTLVSVLEIVHTYEDGKMDIRIRGEKIFTMLELVKEIPEKLYSGAIVTYPANNEAPKPAMLQKIVAQIRELHALLNISKAFPKPDEELNSYDIAHHAGMTLEQEYEFLGLLREDQRLEYLKRYLKKAIPVATGIEGLKDKVKLNGHFRELRGLGFE
jgi:uncharacterized protein